MISANDASIEISDNYGILTKIIRFFKKLFRKEDIKYIAEGNSESSDNKKDNNFFKSIKFEEDPDKAMLLKLQDDFEKMGINRENAIILTKDLTDVQKQKLENLYKEQISNYELSISNYKNKIIAMRKRLAENN